MKPDTASHLNNVSNLSAALASVAAYLNVHMMNNTDVICLNQNGDMYYFCYNTTMMLAKGPETYTNYLAVEWSAGKYIIKDGTKQG